MSVGASAVVIVRDLADAIASTGPATWAASQLREAIVQAGLTAEIVDDRAGPGTRHIVVAGASSAWARRIADASGVTLPTEPEALAIVPGQVDGRSILLAAGAD